MALISLAIITSWLRRRARGPRRCRSARIAASTIEEKSMRVFQIQDDRGIDQVVRSTPAVLDAHVQNEITRWARVIETANVTVERGGRCGGRAPARRQPPDLLRPPPARAGRTG